MSDNETSPKPAAARRRRPRLTRRRGRSYPPCVACRAEETFAWTCKKCDFVMCQSCMNDNLWGMTCNQISWTCPDCGYDGNSFGTR
ncbi:MAG: hypothetical protein HQL50_15970 [Magnetococcales bacterium]|nr:hypothetical protein [Magnetococcales bacterium]